MSNNEYSNMSDMILAFSRQIHQISESITDQMSTFAESIQVVCSDFQSYENQLTHVIQKTCQAINEISQTFPSDAFQAALVQYRSACEEVKDIIHKHPAYLNEDSLGVDFVSTSAKTIESLTAFAPSSEDEFDQHHKQYLGKSKITLSDILAIIMLTVTLFSIVRDSIPDHQLASIESMVRTRIEQGTQIIELEKAKLEESKKQTQLLEKTRSNTNDDSYFPSD